MKADEIRQKTKEELDSLLNELYREQFNLRMQRGVGQTSKPDRIKTVRREIARIKTIMHEVARSAI